MVFLNGFTILPQNNDFPDNKTLLDVTWGIADSSIDENLTMRVSFAIEKTFKDQSSFNVTLSSLTVSYIYFDGSHSLENKIQYEGGLSSFLGS